MLAEPIRELTKCKENDTIPTETVLAWANRVEAQRTQTVVISSLHKSKKNFDAITHKDNRLRDTRHESSRIITIIRCKYSG